MVDGAHLTDDMWNGRAMSAKELVKEDERSLEKLRIYHRRDYVRVAFLIGAEIFAPIDA